jgi:hypothetical protein
MLSVLSSLSVTCTVSLYSVVVVTGTSQHSLSVFFSALSLLPNIVEVRLYSKKNMVSGTQSAIHLHYKGKGVQWERSLLLVEHICICLLISKTTNRKRESTEKGEGRDESWPCVFEYTFLGDYFRAHFILKYQPSRIKNSVHNT